jgi:hypothetical protein
MAVAATVPSGYHDAPGAGNLKFLVRDLVFSGSYQDDGSTSTLNASDTNIKLKKFFWIGIQSGAAAATALTTSNEFAITINSAGTSAEFTFYENAAAGSPSAEKTDNEAFITGQTVRVLIVGF